MDGMRFLVGGYFAVLTACGLALWTGGAFDPPAPPSSRATVNDHLRDHLHATEGALARERADHAETRLQLDTIRRGAIWLPPAPADVRAADLIPAQHLPTIEEVR